MRARGLAQTSHRAILRDNSSRHQPKPSTLPRTVSTPARRGFRTGLRSAPAGVPSAPLPHSSRVIPGAAAPGSLTRSRRSRRALPGRRAGPADGEPRPGPAPGRRHCGAFGPGEKRTHACGSRQARSACDAGLRRVRRSAGVGVKLSGIAIQLSIFARAAAIHDPRSI